MENKVMLKAELLLVMKRFLADEKRGISHALFAELAGISLAHLRDVFVDNKHPLTENIQRKVSRAYTALQNGEVAIMQNKNGSRYLQYRDEAKPALRRYTGLELKDGKISIKLGVGNRINYSDPTLGEQLKRG
jgi:hypothetical protein